MWTAQFVRHFALVMTKRMNTAYSNTLAPARLFP
jgi:hypothetical protein